MIDFLYLITTYNRYDSLIKLVDSILKLRHSKKILILDDYSTDERYLKLKTYNPNVIYYRTEKNNGKINYWQTVNTLYQKAKNFEFKYGITLPDDISLIENFDLIANKCDKKTIIRTFTQKTSKKTNWGYENWVDCSFISPKSFFDDLEFKINPITLSDDYKVSSGVGKQLTERLSRLDYNVLDFGSIVTHLGNNDSKMHPKLRLEEPLDGKEFNGDIVVFGIATIQSRNENLKLTIESIINQVDKIIVYQNGYDEIFDFLNHNKIEVFSSIKTKVDMGDAGKFFKVSEYKNCYYLSGDDDIIYPENYVRNILNSLKKYKNRVIVTHHGRVMKKNPKSYYDDILFGFRCLDDVNIENEIDYGGTGVMGFHTNLVDGLNFNYFKHPNMADIWVGKFTKENKIPILALPHKEGWIKTSLPKKDRNTIFAKYVNNHLTQDKIMTETYVDLNSNKINVVFVSCTYKRPEITKKVVSNWEKVQENTKLHFKYQNIIVDSENTNYDVFNGNKNFEYYNYQNNPISNKWNFAVTKLKNKKFDYVIFLGSDDIIDEELMYNFYDKIRLGYDFIGLKDMYIFDEKTNRLYYWGGYKKESGRYGETIGLGRCLSKNLIEFLNYNPWKPGLNKSLDSSMQAKLKEIPNLSRATINLLTEGGFACDIKSNFNITNIKDYNSSDFKLINKDEQIYKNTISSLGFNETHINDIILSIIIPTYKNTKYIDDCLKSIDTNSCEVLIGIDGCVETKKYFENNEQINNVKVFYFNQNLGPYAIKNTLATIATSNNLLFFDSDDIMNPNMIDTILNGLNRYICVKPKFEEFGGKSLKGTKFGEGVFGIRKDIFLSMNGFEPWKMAADSDFMGRLYKKRVSILHTPQILFKRRIHSESLTNRKDTGMYSPLRAHYARLSKNKKGHGNPVKLHTRDYIEINISNDLEVTSVPQKEKNSVLNLLNRVQQPVIVKEKKEVNYEKVNKVIYNKTQNKKPTKKGENSLINKNLNVRKRIFNNLNNNRNLGGKI